jgi:hypothetical protein
MKKIDRFKSHPVKAETSLNVVKTILTGIFSEIKPSLPTKKYTADITGGEITKPIIGNIKEEGDLFYVYCSHKFTKAGEFTLHVTLKSEGKSIQEIDCPLRAGSFRERLAARMVEDLAGEEASDGLYAYALRLLDIGVSNDQVAGELMKCNPCQRKLIRDKYNKYLGREPQEEEWKSITQSPVHILDTEDLEISLLSSKEYYTKIGKNSNAGFLSALISDLTGSTILPPQYKDWLNEMNNSGESLNKIISTVRDTLPARMKFAADIYEQFYHRKPFAGELKDIAYYAKKGKAGQDGLGVIFNTPTYFQPPGPVEPTMTAGKLPDYTFQFFINLEQANSFAGGKDVRGIMIDSIVEVLDGLGEKYDGQLSADLNITFGELIPGPQVWSVPWNGQENGAIWFDWGYNDFSLKVLDPVPAGGTYIFNVKESALKKLIDKIWARYPKRLNNDGDPTPDGNIELRDYELSLEDDQLRITIFATYHATSEIRIGVSVSYIDKFQLENGLIVNSSSHSLDYDSGIDWIAALTAAIYFITPVTFADEAVKKAKIKEPHLPAFSVGAIISSFFPKTILIPGTSSKLFFPYNSLKLIPGDGIKASGDAFPFLARNPRATIAGGSLEIYFPDAYGNYQLISPSNSATLIKLKFTFEVFTEDLRGPLTIKWTTEGDITNQHGTSVDITWQFDPKKPVQRHVRVDVTDMDNIVATDQEIIHFMGKERVAYPSPNDDRSRRKPFRQNK